MSYSRSLFQTTRFSLGPSPKYESITPSSEGTSCSITVMLQEPSSANSGTDSLLEKYNVS